MSSTAVQKNYGESVAYDLSRFDNRRRVREALAAEPVAIPADPRSVGAAKTKAVGKTQTAEKGMRLSFFAIVSYAAIFLLFLMIVFNYMRLNELSVETAGLQTELARLENDEAKLRIEYERRTNLREIDRRASELGLYSPGADQIVYIDISQPDRAVVYGSGNPTGFVEGVKTLLLAVADFFE